MTAAGPIILASTSPRRRQLLAEAGIDACVIEPGVDDSLLKPGRVTAAQWVMALAYLKARSAAEQTDRMHPHAEHDISRLILAADTICVRGDEILGKPRDADHARAMLRAMRDATHTTITGVCLLWPADLAGRRLFADAARVTIGRLDDDGIDEYVASGHWRGKAGAYNLAERVDAGWPIECDGDPTTVMGLPMRRLLSILTSRGSALDSPPAAPHTAGPIVP